MISCSFALGMRRAPKAVRPRPQRFKNEVGGVRKRSVPRSSPTPPLLRRGNAHINLLKHVRDKVFDFLRELGSDTSSFTQHMQDAVFIIPKVSLLQEAVKIIDDMHISQIYHKEVEYEKLEVIMKKVPELEKEIIKNIGDIQPFLYLEAKQIERAINVDC